MSGKTRRPRRTGQPSGRAEGSNPEVGARSTSTSGKARPGQNASRRLGFWVGIEKLCDGWIEAGWLIALIVTPLVFNVGSTRIFEPEKATVVRSIALLMTAAWVVRWAATGHAGRRLEGMAGRGRCLLRTGGLALSSFLAVNLLATLLSIAPRVSWWGSHDRMQGLATTLAYVAIAALVAGTLRSVNQWRRLVHTVTLTSIPVALYAVVQHLGHDPIPWGTDFDGRVGSTLGNPIFLGGYLAPVALLTAGELAAAWSTPGGIRRRIASTAVLGLALGLQLTALLLSESRGPIAGLLAGVFTTLLVGLLVARSSATDHRAAVWMRHAWLIPIGGVLLAVALLAAVARSDSALASWRDLPSVGRLLSALDPQAETTRFRGLVWRAMDRLWRSPPPIEDSAGAWGDRLASFRPVIGHGPETLRISFPSVSPPELAHLERVHVVPDRAHNEVFDVLATTGVLGLGTFFLLWGCVFASVAAALGWVAAEAGRSGRCQAGLWWALGAGGAAGGFAVAVTGRLMLLGLAFPAGMLIGFFGYSIAATAGGPAPSPRTYGRAASLRVVTLAGALVAHWMEIQTGIAVTATRTYFWIFWAALLVIAAIGLEDRPALPRGADSADRRRPWIESLLAAAVLVTLVFDFGIDSKPTVAILTATWAFSVAMTWARERQLRAVIPGALISLVLSLGFAGLSSVVLADFARRWITAPYAIWLAALLLLLIAIGRRLGRSGPVSVAVSKVGSRRPTLALVSGLVAVAVAVVAVERVSLRPIRADMLFRAGQERFGQERFEDSLELYRFALEVDPKNDRLWLARGHLERIRALRARSEGERQEWLEQAAGSIDRAVELHPLFIDHRVNRARLYSAWSDLSRDPEAARQRRSRAASDLEFAAARSPGSTDLRNLLAELYLHQGRRQQAEALFRKSLAIDPRTVGTYLSLARVFLEEAAGGRAGAEASLRAALELYDQAIAVAPRFAAIHAGRGYVLTRLGRLEPAAAAYSQALAIRPGDAASHLGLAILHRRLGRAGKAREHAERAYELGDESVKNRAAEVSRELAEQG